MRTLRALLWLVVIGACSGGDAAKQLGPTSLVVQGSWLFRQSLAAPSAGITCYTQGLVAVTQTGPRFTASGSQDGACSSAAGTQGISGAAFSSTDGTIDSTNITLTVDACTYDGVAIGAAPDSVKGTVSCDGFAGSNVKFQGQFSVVPPPDHQPPAVQASTYSTGPNGTSYVIGDDTLFVVVHATDDRAVRAVGFEFSDPSHSGPAIHRDSVLIVGKSVTDTLAWPLPLYLTYDPPYPAGTPYQLTAFARDSAGNLGVAATVPIALEAPVPPSVRGSLTGFVHDSVGALRDTITITVTATSPRALTYYGYRFTSSFTAGDSVAVTADSGTHVFKIPVPFAWKGDLLSFEIFSRDGLGLQARHALPDSARVVVFPSRPAEYLALNEAVPGLVVDGARQRIYLSTAVDTGFAAGTPEIKVVQMSPAHFLPGLRMPTGIGRLDITASGDSLVIVLFSGRLAIVHTATLTIDSTAPLVFAPGGGSPFAVRVLANNKAMVSAWGTSNAGVDVPGQLVAFDLATISQSLRTDVGASGAVGLVPYLGRSGDRQSMLLWSSSASSSMAQLYRSNTDQFGAPVAIPDTPGGISAVSGDHTGAHWLVGGELLGSDLTLQRTFLTPPSPYGASVLSDDGAYAYISVAEGVLKFRVSDGAQVERILLPDPPYLLGITPDGNTLLAVGGYGMLLVDLR